MSVNGMDRLLPPRGIVCEDYTAAPGEAPQDSSTPPFASIGIAEAYFARKGCAVLLQPTPKAIHTFNSSHAKKIGLFHVST
jgi:hypothetical protein